MYIPQLKKPSHLWARNKACKKWRYEFEETMQICPGVLAQPRHKWPGLVVTPGQKPQSHPREIFSFICAHVPRLDAFRPYEQSIRICQTHARKAVGVTRVVGLTLTTMDKAETIWGAYHRSRSKEMPVPILRPKSAQTVA